MKAKLIGQSRLWSAVVLSRQEPYVLTHGVEKLVPGSYVRVDCFKKVAFAFIKARACTFLRTQLKGELARTKGYSPSTEVIIPNILEECIDDLLMEVLAPLEITSTQPGDKMYAIPWGPVWAGGGSRCHNAFFTPILVVSVEQNPQAGEPRLAAVHAQMPLKPSAILAACELLSCSFPPGLHHLLAHIPRFDVRTFEETVAAYAIIFTRTSAFADLARTSDTDVQSDMLRSGAGMREIREFVASKAGKWAIRHVLFQRDEAAAPNPHHPSGCVDGSYDQVPDMDV